MLLRSLLNSGFRLRELVQGGEFPESFDVVWIGRNFHKVKNTKHDNEATPWPVSCSWRKEPMCSERGKNHYRTSSWIFVLISLSYFIFKIPSTVEKDLRMQQTWGCLAWQSQQPKRSWPVKTFPGTNTGEHIVRMTRICLVPTIANDICQRYTFMVRQIRSPTNLLSLHICGLSTQWRMSRGLLE